MVFQPGITVNNMILHHENFGIETQPLKLTIDSNGNSLGQDVTISANKGGDLAKLVVLEIVGWSISTSSGLDNFDVEIVGLRNNLDGVGPRVIL